MALKEQTKQYQPLITDLPLLGNRVRNCVNGRVASIENYTTEYDDRYGGSPDVPMVYVIGWNDEMQSTFADNWYLADIEGVQ